MIGATRRKVVDFELCAIYIKYDHKMSAQMYVSLNRVLGP
jgi:hypothetical protein